jgi:hypothetical protein
MQIYYINMSRNQILLSGCSFTDRRSWPTVMFPDCNIDNRARSGSGNRYISDSIVDAIHTGARPHMVFILWTAIARADLVLPAIPAVSKLFENYEYCRQIRNVMYYFTGGNKFDSVIRDNFSNIYPDHLTVIQSIKQYLDLDPDVRSDCEDNELFWFKNHSIRAYIEHYAMLQYLPCPEYMEDLSYQHIVSCHDILEKYDIPYRFGFIMDPFDTDHTKQFGNLTKQHDLYGCIDWSKYVKLNPYEYAVKHDLLSSDSFHLSDLGYCTWAKEVRNHYF